MRLSVLRVALALGVAAALPWGAARDAFAGSGETPGESPEPRTEERRGGAVSVGGAIGRGIDWGLDQIPFVGGVVKGVNNGARRVVDGVRGRGARREAERSRQMLRQLCAAHPEAHAQACARRFPELGEFFSPRAGSGAPDSSAATSPPAAGPASREPPAGVASALVASIKRRQGFRAEPYVDTGGDLHQFYGHNLSANRVLFADIVKHRRAAKRVVGEDCWAGLTDARRDVVTQLAYDHGEAGFARWENFIAALCAGRYPAAKEEMADSAWMLDAGAEGLVLAEIVRRGDY